MMNIGIVGTGYVADLYMRSIQIMPNLSLAGAYDINHGHSFRFGSFWRVPIFNSLEELLEAIGPHGIVLNLTNPSSHFDISYTCLERGYHVYSEKPLANNMIEALELYDIALDKNLLLASAPCSFLGQAAQTVGTAIHKGIIGRPRLIYAELDDDFIAQAPYHKWLSESGAPWPAEDEFRVGCTLEHAGYYLTWLISIFGSIRKVVATSARLVSDQLPIKDPGPDFSVATLFFENGIVARMTCSIIAPHDHRLRIIGDQGVLELDEAWNNKAIPRYRKRFSIRRRLIYALWGKRIRLKGKTHPKVGRWGAASMNFALGPAEMVESLAEKRPPRISAELALHLTEITLAIQNAGETNVTSSINTKCSPIKPMPWAKHL